MPVVSNTSPLLALAIVGRLALLREQFGEIWMPPAVLEELRIEDNLPGSQSVRDAMAVGWLQVKEVTDRSLAQVLQRQLDKGEAEAIALARQVNAEWTLLKCDRRHRHYATSKAYRKTAIVTKGTRRGARPGWFSH